MRFRRWTLELEDGYHTVELQHGWWSGLRIIRVDGAVFERTKLVEHLVDFGSTHRFAIGTGEGELRIGSGLDWGFSYRLTIDGKTMRPQKGPPEPRYEAEIQESAVAEEPLGTETRVIDNSGSSASVTRRLSVTKEWHQSYSIKTERSDTRGASGEIDAGTMLSVAVTAEACLRHQYSVTREIRKSQTEEVIIEVPPRTSVTVRFSWKRLVRSGPILVRAPGHRELCIPFSVVTGVTFDQLQSDA